MLAACCADILAALKTPPQVASTLVVTPKLAFPTQLIEIKLIAKLG